MCSDAPSFTPELRLQSSFEAESLTRIQQNNTWHINYRPTDEGPIRKSALHQGRNRERRWKMQRFTAYVFHMRAATLGPEAWWTLAAVGRGGRDDLNSHWSTAADVIKGGSFVPLLLERRPSLVIYITFSHLAETFIQSDLQMMTIEAIKTNKRAMKCECYDKSWLAQCSTCSKVFIHIHTHTYIYIYIYMYVCVCVCIQYINIHIHIYIHIHTHIHTYTVKPKLFRHQI